MTELVEVALELQSTCLARQWPFCIIGGLAVQHWGEPRFTKNVDMTVLTGFGGEEPIVHALFAIYEPRIDDARSFALMNRVLLLKARGGIGIDIALGALDFELSAVGRAKDILVLKEKSLRLCSAEDLIVMKAFADRGIDWHDIEGILTRQGHGALDWLYIFKQLEPLCEVKEAPEILPRLRALWEALDR